VSYNNRNLGVPVHTGKFLAYPPFAQCADTQDGGYCDMPLEGRNVVLTAAAAQVDGANGAAALMRLGYDNLNAIVQAIARQTPVQIPMPGGVDSCAVVTMDDVQAALKQRVPPPRRDGSGACTWRGTSGDALTIQGIETGQAGFENAQARTHNIVAVAGIGDAAFAFVSQAGFVQLNAVKNNHYVVVTLQKSGAGVLDAAKAIAAKIASNL
jgi:hypothetical protein